MAATPSAGASSRAGETATGNMLRVLPMKRFLILVSSAALFLAGQQALATERYATRPPVVVSPDLSAPWVMQLGQKPGKLVRPKEAAQPQPQARQQTDTIRTAAIRAPAKRDIKRQIDPIYLPQQVAYEGKHKPGTIIIDTTQNFLYLIEKDGHARRYGVGTGKPGFEWAGTHKVTRKATWPDWRPPAQMIARERAKGRHLPNFLPGGPENPLGARALYLGSTLYRIHGTNQPWTIGAAVSSGCIRMRNEDVVDLYERVPVGATVVVM